MRRNEVEMDQTEFRLSGVGLLTSFDSILVVRTGYGKELSGENAFPGAYVRKSDDVEEALEKRWCTTPGCGSVCMKSSVSRLGSGCAGGRRDRTAPSSSMPSPNAKEMVTSAKTHEIKWVPSTQHWKELSDTARRWLPDAIIDFLEDRITHQREDRSLPRPAGIPAAASCGSRSLNRKQKPLDKLSAYQGVSGGFIVPMSVRSRAGCGATHPARAVV